MNYPVWYIPVLGGPLIIAVIAITHVLVSHFAVGGGLWLVLTEKKARKLKKPLILEYVKEHTLFFMLLTLVLGAITGVGIWFVISLTAPDATSLLIHLFVFAWAIEWICFVIEIVTAFLYYYTFHKISARLHQTIGWIYFLAAWASLFIINAILSFMLSPGKWIETKDFWHAVLNPTFLPSTVFRTFLSFALAGAYALLTTTRKLNGEERQELVRYNGRWILFSLLGIVPSLAWYYFSIPSPLRQGLLSKSWLMKHSLIFLLATLIVLPALVILFTKRRAAKMKFSAALSILAVIFIFFGSFEFMRESARKPFIIGEYLLPTGLDYSRYQTTKWPILKHAKWVRIKKISADNKMKAGEDLYRIQCYACHSLGFKNNFVPVVKKWNMNRIRTMLGRLQGITPQMPPFVGTNQEREALAFWLYTISHTDQPMDVRKRPAPEVSGESLFKNLCTDCHDSPDEIRNKLKTIPNILEMVKLLERLDTLSDDMPSFEGTEQEKEALSKYLFQVSRNK